jgi:AraC-like DNA-binding protein
MPTTMSSASSPGRASALLDVVPYSWSLARTLRSAYCAHWNLSDAVYSSRTLVLVLLADGVPLDRRIQTFHAAFLTWLAEHADAGDVTVKEAARDLKCAPSTLQRRIRLLFGTTFHQVFRHWVRRYEEVLPATVHDHEQVSDGRNVHP